MAHAGHHGHFTQSRTECTEDAEKFFDRGVSCVDERVLINNAVSRKGHHGHFAQSRTEHAVNTESFWT